MFGAMTGDVRRGKGVSGQSSTRLIRLWLCVLVAASGAALALPVGAAALEGVSVRGNATGGDSGVIASVFVGATPGRICAGVVRHAGRRAKLPALHTGKSGNGRWRWRIGAGVPSGSWRVRVRCQLATGPATGRTVFRASGTGSGRGRGSLVAPGSMSTKAIDRAGLTKGGGRGGNEEEENGYPEGQCTWWARHKRPDIPVFPGSAGDARNWAASARRADPGFTVGRAAKPGAIVVFQPGQAGAGRFGHVAYVVRVRGSWMTISEANYHHTKPGSQRTLQWRGRHLRFIYAKNARTKHTPQPAGSFRFHVFRTCTNGHCGLVQKLGPGLHSRSIGERLPDDTAVDIICQTRGDRVIGFDATSTDVWDRLIGGSYVSDYFVDTPGKDDQFSVPVPDCAESAEGPPHVATISFTAPATGQILSGETTLSASSDAPVVRFEAFYSDSLALSGAARWHLLGVDESPGDGFHVSWDTTAVPNQGLRSEGTVRVAAIAVDEATEMTDAEDTRLVAVANPDGEGNFVYRVVGTCEEATCALNERSGPGFSLYPPVGSAAEGSELKIVCQAEGENVSGSLGVTAVWDELSDGSWVSDYYVDTPVGGDFSPPIPRCGSVPAPPVPTIAISAPENGEILSGTAALTAISDAPGVRFEAFYSDTPGVSGTAEWHQLGDDTSAGDGLSLAWNTALVPNQGQPLQSTVRVRAVALDYRGHPTSVQDVRRINLANAAEDGSYHYHVYGTCGNGSCFVNLRSGPSQTTYPVVATRNEGDELAIACQTPGEVVSDGTNSSNIWDELTDGSWVTDFYVDTPNAGVFSPPIPEC